jgi:hypothetical protein
VTFFITGSDFTAASANRLFNNNRDSIGIPSHDTFRQVFGLIDAEAFEDCFAAWAESQAESGPNGELVAIDGKTIRRSFDHGREQSPLHVADAP